MSTVVTLGARPQCRGHFWAARRCPLTCCGRSSGMAHAPQKASCLSLSHPRDHHLNWGNMSLFRVLCV